MRAREEAHKAARQAEYMNMLISQIEDMSQSVNLALAVLGPIVVEPNSVGHNEDHRGGPNGHNNADGPDRQSGGSSSARYSQTESSGGNPGSSQMQHRSNRQNDGRVGDAQGVDYPAEPRLGRPIQHPGGDLRNDAGQAIARIDGNMPDQWRDVDLTEAGRAVNQGMRTGMGRHVDTMKRVSILIHHIGIGIRIGIRVLEPKNWY